VAANASERRYWLFKTEPESFSYEDLVRAPRSRIAWDGVRNYQARNSLRDDVKLGDGVLVYHSSTEPPGVVGVARVVGESAVDPTQFDPRDEHFDAGSERASPRWVQVEIEAVFAMPRFLPLDELRADPSLAGMALLQRGQRLSIQPVKPAEWQTVLERGGADPADFDGGGKAPKRKPRIR
jgi:predicted RNA-binding protein with PUA-like domain